MTRTLLILGSGPAAVGACLAALRHDDVDVTMIDVGRRLEVQRDAARSRLGATGPADWTREDVDTITELPVESKVKGPPEKRSYGSDFPFRDYGQRGDLRALNGVNDALISGAYGGFSNVWGAQIMPFTDATFERWPVQVSEMRSHYAHVLAQIPFAGEDDDLGELFPLLSDASPLPALSERSLAVLNRYHRHRSKLRARGIVLGRARLAMSAPPCIRCGLCLSGCPYSLIYSASQTIDRLRAAGRITYRGGLLAVRVEEDTDSATVIARDVGGRGIHRFSADRVLVACGGVGTSRLVMGSLNMFERSAPVQESAQFMLPFASGRPVTDPRATDDFALNQFNMVLDMDGRGYDLSQLHFYTYSPSFLDALPRAIKMRAAAGLRGQLFRRLSVALGYLPSWRSPGFELRVNRPSEPYALPAVSLTSPPPEFSRNRMLREVLRRLVVAAPYLDLWPLVPALSLSARGKSYHWGGVFPHSDTNHRDFSSDTLGRVAPWTRIHLIDASVFPTVPATTFTLTVMANAHRITSATLEGDS